MDGHIARLIAACGLAHFSYRQWAASELQLARPAPLPEAGVPETAPAILADRAAPPPVDAAPPLASPPVSLPPPAPPAPFAVAVAQPPVRLSAPEPLLPHSTMPPRPPGGRPPVVLPPPDDAGPLIGIRGGRRAVDRRAPVHVPVVPPAAPPPRNPARPAAPRRFALLDEIGPTDTPPRGGRPVPPRAPRSP